MDYSQRRMTILYEFINNEGEWLPYDVLCERFGICSKTLLQDIRYINDKIKIDNAEIRFEKKLGFSLNVPDYETTLRLRAKVEN